MYRCSKILPPLLIPSAYPTFLDYKGVLLATYKGFLPSLFLLHSTTASQPFCIQPCDHQHTRALSLSEINNFGVQMASLMQRAPPSLPQAPKIHTPAPLLPSLMFLSRQWPALQLSWFSNQLLLLLMISNIFSQMEMCNSSCLLPKLIVLVERLLKNHFSLNASVLQFCTLL